MAFMGLILLVLFFNDDWDGSQPVTDAGERRSWKEVPEGRSGERV